MANFSNTDRSFCIGAYYEHGRSAVAARRALMSKFKLKKLCQCPSVRAIKLWIEKCEERGLIEKIREKPRLNTVRTPLKIDQVRKVVKENPRVSQRRIAAITGTKRTTIQVIMKSDLALHPNKIQMTQSLDEKDYEVEMMDWRHGAPLDLSSSRTPGARRPPSTKRATRTC